MVKVYDFWIESDDLQKLNDLNYKLCEAFVGNPDFVHSNIVVGVVDEEHKRFLLSVKSSANEFSVKVKL